MREGSVLSLNERFVRHLEAAAIRTTFTDDEEREAKALALAPGFDDDTLVDHTDLAFVTIDGPDSKDLDQAAYAEKRDDVFVIYYALADASYYVRPGTHLWRGAAARGASFYCPMFVSPMLPRGLSEDLISLNPNVVRRSLMFRVEVSSNGEVTQTSLVRARMRSRHKLAFSQVDDFYQNGHSPWSPEVAQSLGVMREFAHARIQRSENMGVVRFSRAATRFEKSPATDSLLVARTDQSLESENVNEQLSLLVNGVGAEFLLSQTTLQDPDVQAIYRIHAAPSEEAIANYAGLTSALAAEGRWPSSLVFLPSAETLAAFVRRLGKTAIGESEQAMLARALLRQAMLLNVRSEYSAEAGKHFGVGANPYARFSAPMREIVGIFVHKEALEALAPGHADESATRLDQSERLQIIESANRAKQVQKALNDEALRCVLDAVFEQTVATKSELDGLIMGITAAKIHVQVRTETCELDAKVYVRDLGQARANAWLEVRDAGTRLCVRDTGEVVCLLGEKARVSALGVDAKQDRWVMNLRRVT